MDDKLLSQIELLDENIHLLEEIRQKTLEEYLHDRILQGAAERYLQIAIETCLNIGIACSRCINWSTTSRHQRRMLIFLKHSL